jgi:hypothetical protein
LKGFVSVQPEKHLDFTVPPAVVLLNYEAAMDETKNMGGAAHGREACKKLRWYVILTHCMIARKQSPAGIGFFFKRKFFQTDVLDS